MVLSWRGPLNRYWFDGLASGYGSEVYYRGKVLAVAPDGYYVEGAAVQGSTLVVVLGQPFVYVDETSHSHNAVQESVWTAPFRPSDITLAELTHAYDIPTDFSTFRPVPLSMRSPWYFDADGKEARSIFFDKSAFGSWGGGAFDPQAEPDSKTYIRQLLVDVENNSYSAVIIDTAAVTFTYDSHVIRENRFFSLGTWTGLINILTTRTANGESFYAVDYDPKTGWHTAKVRGSYTKEEVTFDVEFLAEGPAQDEGASVDNNYVSLSAHIDLVNEDDAVLLPLRNSTISLAHVSPSSWSILSGQVFHGDVREETDDGFGFFGWVEATDTGSDGAYHLDPDNHAGADPPVGFHDPQTHTTHKSFELDGFDTLKEEDGSFMDQFVSTAFPYELTQPFQASANIPGSWVHDHHRNFCMSMIFTVQTTLPLTGEARNFLTDGDLQQLTSTDGSVIFPIGLG
jgi:hypothetical protein